MPIKIIDMKSRTKNEAGDRRHRFRNVSIRSGAVGNVVRIGAGPAKPSAPHLVDSYFRGSRRSAGGEDSGPLDLLLIEDSPSDAWLVEQQLREAGDDIVHVTTVTNLAQALRAAADHRFDAALLDLNLPDSEGLATFEGFHSAAPSIPLVVLSGVANADIALTVLRKGAQDCVLKSEVPGALLDRVVRLAIERQRIANELDRRFVQLEKNETRIREIIQQSREAFIAVNDEGIVTFVNDAAVAMLGRSADRFVGRPFEWKVGSGGTIDISIRRQDGSMGVGELRSIGQKAGAQAESLMSLRDITERRLADAAIRDSEYRLRALLEHSVDSILLVDSMGRVKYATPSVAKITGYTLDEWRDADGLSFLFADDMEQRRRLLDELDTEPDRSQTIKWRFCHKHGRLLHFEGVATNFLAAPSIGGIVINFTDVTQRHRIEEAQRQSQKLEALGTLAGGIAHDFNNILLAIVGNTRLAIEDLPEKHPARQSLSEVDKASRRAAELVRRILSFSRREAPQRAALDLRSAIEDVVELLRATLPASVRLRLRLGQADAVVAADLTQIHQVMLNLVTNAAHAIVAKSELQSGCIDIALEEVILDKETAASIGDVPPGRYACVSVADDGGGIDPDVLPRIFEPFFTTKAKGQGTGLGLSVAHGIMLEHDGAISVYSEQGKGSMFRLYFPKTEATAVESTNPEVAAPTGHGELILYIDDDEALVFLAQRAMRDLGYDVVTYTDPVEALRDFDLEPSKYRAVVSDVSMPGMSGLQVAQAIRAVDRTIPIILTSGYLRQEEKDRATSLGVTDFILKPNTIEALGATLHRCLLHASTQTGQAPPPR